MLNAVQLTHFRERQAASLMDTCHRLVYSSTFNDLNEPVEVWTENNTDLPCGLEQQAGSERRRDNDTLIEYDAILRLPLSDLWNFKDRVKITKRFSETLTTSLTYWIVSPVQRGPSGIRLLLKVVSV